MDDQNANFLADSGFVPTSDPLSVYPSTREGRLRQDGALPDVDGPIERVENPGPESDHDFFGPAVISHGALPPPTPAGQSQVAAPAPSAPVEDLFRAELVQAETVAVLALIANDFFSRSIAPATTAEPEGVLRRAPPAETSAYSGRLTLRTLPTRHWQEHPTPRRHEAAAISPEVETDVPTTTDCEHPITPVYSMPPLTFAPEVQEPSRPVADLPPAPSAAPPQIWPSNVIAFPGPRRAR